MKKHYPAVFFVIALIVIAAFSLELYYLRLKSVPLLTKIILLLPLNITIIALLTLMFYVAKSLIKLYFERKHKILGYKFKTKLVVTLVILTLIPATLLFFISSGFITNYIDRWFVPEIRQPLERSIEIAKSVYLTEREQTLNYARGLATGSPTRSNYRVHHLLRLPEDPSETVKAAFGGKEGTEIFSRGNVDIIRAVVPAFQGSLQKGVLVVEYQIPATITRDVEQIQDAYESYLTLETWKLPIKMNYLLTLGFFTLIIIFLAMWIALRISRGITDSIQLLAQATGQVASGNLDINIIQSREDELGHLVFSFNDMVRKLKAGQEKLQAAYLYLKNILDNINSGVILLDTSGNISMINGAACAILNIQPDEVTHKNYRTLMSRIDSDELQNLVEGIEGKAFKPVKKDLKAIIGDKRIVLSVFITGLKDPQKYIGLLVVVDDITDILEAQKTRTWQEVARRIAHEVKNPLTPIKLSTERLIRKWKSRDADFDQVFSRSAETIVKEVESLRRLVDEFSRYGKLPEIYKTRTDIVSVTQEIVNLYKDFNEIDIEVILPENPPFLYLDANQFKRVLINLFDNAIQAMNNKGKIILRVSFDMSAHLAYMDIADNGPGIKNEDKEKLFLPYFSTRKEGTGLGLAIAHRIITEHGGRIWAKDNTPHGTIFTIEIPLKEN
jgi:two-component system nitrogen regulation sensor histidine kinase NtrY